MLGFSFSHICREGAIRKRRDGGRGGTVGNSLGRAPVGRSNMEATREWTGGSPWEIACGESSGGKERCGSDERVDGRETVSLGRAPVGRSDTGREAVENSLGRAPVGRRDTGVTAGWTEGKPWEIAWGELRWEGAIRE